MAKAVPPIEPITAATLPDFCAFLTANLNAQTRPDEWRAAFETKWECSKPNYGFLFRDPQGAIAGGLGTIYSRQVIDGKQYEFCNLTSWCVTEPYRAQSMRLAMAVTAQPGFEITNFSPTKVVAGVLRFLNFREIDEHVSFFPNFPALPSVGRRVRILWDPREIEASLTGTLAATYRDHRGYPWLRLAVLEAEQRQCLLIVKYTHMRSVRGAKVLYVSDRGLFARNLRAVCGSFLWKLGAPFTQIESRFLERRPRFRRDVGGYTRKLFLSRSLSADQIDYIYSESMCLDI